MILEFNFRKGLFNAKIKNLYLTPSGQACLGCHNAPWRLGSKNGIKQNVLIIEFQLRIHKLVFDPLWSCPFGCALVPQGDLQSKHLL
jgi:hypothetical protein